MNVARAMGFVFRDPRWVGKAAVAGGLLLIPIVGWLIALGYGLRIVRGVVAGTDVPLPAWDEWGGLLADGLKGAVVGFIWSLLPSVLVLVPNVVDGGSPGVLAVGAGLLNLAGVAIIPTALARVAVHRSLVAGIEGGPVVRLIGRNLGDYLLIVAISLGGSIALAVVVGLLALVALAAGTVSDSATVFGIGFLVAGVVSVVGLLYLQSVLYHLYGQANYRSEPSVW